MIHPHLAHGLASGAELAFAAIDDDQIGHDGPAILLAIYAPFSIGATGAAETSPKDLGHGSEIIGALHRLDAKAPIVLLAGHALHEHYHASRRMRALDIGYVVTLDARGGPGQVQGALNLAKRLDMFIGIGCPLGA